MGLSLSLELQCVSEKKWIGNSNSLYSNAARNATNSSWVSQDESSQVIFFRFSKICVTITTNTTFFSPSFECRFDYMIDILAVGIRLNGCRYFVRSRKCGSPFTKLTCSWLFFLLIFTISISSFCSLSRSMDQIERAQGIFFRWLENRDGIQPSKILFFPLPICRDSICLFNSCCSSGDHIESTQVIFWTFPSKIWLVTQKVLSSGPTEGTWTRPDYMVNRADKKIEGPFGENICTKIEK